MIEDVVDEIKGCRRFLTKTDCQHHRNELAFHLEKLEEAHSTLFDLSSEFGNTDTLDYIHDPPMAFKKEVERISKNPAKEGTKNMSIDDVLRSFQALVEMLENGQTLASLV